MRKKHTVDVSPVVGTAEGLVTVIKSGLEAGEIVVTEGLDKLQPGGQSHAAKVECISRGSLSSRRRDRVVLGGDRYFRSLGFIAILPSRHCHKSTTNDTGRYVLFGGRSRVMTSSVTAALGRQFGQIPD